MADPMEGGGGPSIMDRMNQGQLGVGGGGEGGGEGAGGNLIDAILRMLGINGHSTTGLDGFLGLGSVFSGLSLQGKSIVTSQLDRGNGVLSSLLSGFDSGAPPEGAPIEDAPIDTSGESGGGDAQIASLESIPTAPMVEAAQPIQGMHEAMPAAANPRASSARGASSRGESMER